MLMLQCDTNVTKNLQWLRGRSELCDVVVIDGDGQQNPAHSCVLAVHSTVIAAVLQGRLAASRDWSVMRPLIISIDDASLKNSAAGQDAAAGINVMEALVRLLYGEKVSISPSHLALLIQYAEMLGLSHQILDCLHSKVPFSNEENPSTDKGRVRKKHSRKPVLKGNLKNTDKATESLVQDKLEECIAGPPQPESKPVLEQEKQTKFQVADSFEEKSDADSSMLDLSMLCSDVQGLSSGLNSSWTLVQCQDQNTTQPSITELQEGHESVPGFEEEASLERLGGTTNESSMEDLTSKLEFTNQASEMEGEGTSCTGNEGTNDMLSVVVSAEQQQNICSGETQKLLQKKKQQKQRSVGRGLICTVCGSAFQRCGDLVKHVQNMQHFTVECPLCFVQVRDLEDQRLHFALHDQELPFFCMYCDLRFRTRAALTMHMPKHSTSKPFVCSDCGRGFKWRHALQAHLYTHSPTIRLLCDICGFSSKYVSSFKAHLLQHSGRAFPCPHPGCSFTSKRKTHLNDHLATHSKTRVHQCEVCGHSFSHAKNLRRHMRLHAPASNLLTCLAVSKLQCNFRTTRPDKLHDHLAKKHNLSRHALSSSDSLVKLINTSSSLTSNESNGIQKQAPDLTNLSNLASAESTSYSLVQEPSEDIPVMDKLAPKSLDPDNITGMVEEHVRYQTADQTGKASIEGHAGIAAPQDNFSVLVNSPDIDLPDIQSLENHSNQAEKQENVTSITVSPVLVEHNILLNKADTANVASSQHLGADNISGIQNNLVQETNDKMQLSVHQSGLQEEGNLQLVTGSHVQAMSYSQHCSFARTDDVVLEDNVTVGEMSSSSNGHGSNLLLDEEESQKKNEKQEQCMESLNILDFMLDNVTG
ncbi:zinc finger protein ZFAT-like [Penaeus monodon]|uniref:zinc finger protein ZFAT-like n=1 Tax=Penaeus monodon TaxID=6687 RepID=UPI0018A76F46|nr:zinc finger protein ZFAT-like [Penaeus monodon]